MWVDKEISRLRSKGGEGQADRTELSCCCIPNFPPISVYQYHHGAPNSSPKNSEGVRLSYLRISKRDEGIAGAHLGRLQWLGV